MINQPKREKKLLLRKNVGKQGKFMAEFAYLCAKN